MELISICLESLMIILMIFLSIRDVIKRKVPLWGLLAIATIVVAGVVNRIVLDINRENLSNEYISNGYISNEYISNGYISTGFIKGEIASVFIGMLPGVMLLLVSFATKKVGVADGILLCMIGAYQNYLIAVIIFVTSSFLMAVISMILLVARRVNRNTRLPYVPFLTLGFVLSEIVFLLYR